MRRLHPAKYDIILSGEMPQTFSLKCSEQARADLARSEQARAPDVGRVEMQHRRLRAPRREHGHRQVRVAREAADDG